MQEEVMRIKVPTDNREYERYNIVLLSGGMDSTTCMADAALQEGHLCALHINYGQLTQERELREFNEICEHFEVKPEHQCIVDLPVLKLTNSALVGNMDLDTTGEAISDSSIVPLSYVPFRNAHILSAAVSWGESFHTFDGQRPKTIIELNIVHGAVEEDAAGYPDCREEFYNLFTKTANIGTRDETVINFITPVIRMTKPEIIEWAWELNAPLQLSWSCYSSGDEEEAACGYCDSCILRVAAFKTAGVIDPVPYARDVDFGARSVLYSPMVGRFEEGGV